MIEGTRNKIIKDCHKDAYELAGDIIHGIYMLTGESDNYVFYDEDFDSMAVVGKYDVIRRVLNALLESGLFKIDTVFEGFGEPVCEGYDKEYTMYITKHHKIMIEHAYRDERTYKNTKGETVTVPKGYPKMESYLFFVEASVPSKAIESMNSNVIIFSLDECDECEDFDFCDL